VVLLWLELVLVLVLAALAVVLAVQAVLVGGVAVGAELSFCPASLLVVELGVLISKARLDQQDSENKLAYTALICAKLSGGYETLSGPCRSFSSLEEELLKWASWSLFSLKGDP
jgi:hypothetical protein